MSATTNALTENGNPLTVYHWTDMGDFDRFEYTNDIGFHFGTFETATHRRSQVYGDAPAPDSANERMIKATLHIKSPLRLPDLHDWSPKSVVNALNAAGILSDEAADDAYGEIIDLDWIRPILTNAGYDSIVYQNETELGGDSWIAFNADHIEIVDRQPFSIQN